MSDKMSDTVKFQVAKDDSAPVSYKLRMNADLYNYIRNKPNSTFEHGLYSLKCKKKGKSKLKGFQIQLGINVPAGMCKMHPRRCSTIVGQWSEFAAKKEALEEVFAAALADYNSSQSDESERLLSREFSIVAEPNTELAILFLPEQVYDDLAARQNKSDELFEHNGIFLSLGKQNTPGFGNGRANTLYLDESARGKRVYLDHGFRGYGKLRKKLPQLEEFFDNLITWLELTPYPAQPDPTVKTQKQKKRTVKGVHAAALLHALLSDD